MQMGALQNGIRRTKICSGQIELHKEKKQIVENEENLELVDYYEKEIRAKEETLRKKKS